MKAILVDDEMLALEFLESQLKKVSELEIVAKFTFLDVNDEGQTKLIKESDIIFLDIDMPEINGIMLAEKLLELNPSIHIIFVTAHKDYAVQAFDLNALDYLLKPVRLERLKKTLERIEVGKQEKSVLPSEPFLRVNVCKELTFDSAKYKQENVYWRTLKTQELFLYLLQHAGEMIRKAELIEQIWKEMDESKGYSQLYTAIYYARKTLKQFHEHFTLKNVQEGYVLNVHNVFIDVVEWERKLPYFTPVTPKTVHEYEEIMKLYTGDYLETYDYLWAVPERVRLQQLWLKAAYNLASYYYDNKMYEESVNWYVKICQTLPEEEYANFMLMKLYAQMDYGLLVKHQYKQLEKALAELGVEMNQEIKTWYQSWS